MPGDPPRPQDREVLVTLAPNPSHLEAVSPVVLGMVRAQQAKAGDEDASRIMGILIHGDAAFSGLGLVSECLQLSNVEGTICDVVALMAPLTLQGGRRAPLYESHSCPQSDHWQHACEMHLHVAHCDTASIVKQ